jgi:hypothetical protein
LRNAAVWKLLGAARMKTQVAVLLLAFAGCSAQVQQAQQQQQSPDAGEPKHPPLNGGGTASGCMGVTEKGHCELSDAGEFALSCDIPSSKLIRIDCTAMSKHCVLDAHKGATCEALPKPPETHPADGGTGAPADGGSLPTPPTPTPPPPPPPGTPPKPPVPPPPSPPTPPTPPPPSHDMGTTPPMSHPDLGAPPMSVGCTHGVTYEGYCAATTAIWCDPSTGQTVAWNCAIDGYTCEENGCADGAYCCGTPQMSMADMATPTEASPECLALGYTGACDGDTATWCDNGNIVRIDCGARSQSCMVDTCASGAYCCDAPADAPDLSDVPDLGDAPDLVDECAQLGTAGACDGDTVRYCASDGTVHTIDCTALGESCKVDTCGAGANCCS